MPEDVWPAQDASEERRVEALGRWQASLDFGHGDLVLGRGAQQGEAARHGAEHLCGVGHHAQQRLFLERKTKSVAFGKGDGPWEERARGLAKEWASLKENRLCRNRLCKDVFCVCTSYSLIIVIPPVHQLNLWLLVGNLGRVERVQLRKTFSFSLLFFLKQSLCGQGLYAIFRVFS